MKIIIFGVGKFYHDKKEEFCSYTDVIKVAFIDNNQHLQGTYIDGILVWAVEKIVALDFDRIVLMSIRIGEMKKQLLELGVEAEKIWSWERFRGERLRGSFHFYCVGQKKYIRKEKILIITTELNYNGGTLAAVYAGKELQKLGYRVVLATPGGNDIFIGEIQRKEGIDIMVCRSLPCLFLEELSFAMQFDIIFINVFQMISCVNEISKFKPVIWWIHEPSIFYESAMEQFSEYMDEDWMNKIHIYAVSRIAQRNFNYYFPNKIKSTLTYGIPDQKKHTAKSEKRETLVFAVIGNITSIKGQDIFLEAVKKTDDNLKTSSSFWIIGKAEEGAYYNNIKRLVSKEPSVKLLGEMTREEIQNTYEKIDVLICPSREETLSIVVTEAMMYGKVCIVSDSTGMADYILHGENGFIFRTGDSTDLSEQIKWVFQNRENLQPIGIKARSVYERYFTMKCFGCRLEKVISEIKNI